MNSLKINEMKTPVEIELDLANRIKSIRRVKKISQRELAEKSGVSFGSIRRFEASGNISLLSLVKISIALGKQQEFSSLFLEKEFASIEEVIKYERNRTKS